MLRGHLSERHVPQLGDAFTTLLFRRLVRVNLHHLFQKVLSGSGELWWWWWWYAVADGGGHYVGQDERWVAVLMTVERGMGHR